MKAKLKSNVPRNLFSASGYRLGRARQREKEMAADLRKVMTVVYAPVAEMRK